APSNQPAPRKRIRKRKRRVVSDSSSSSSASDSDDAPQLVYQRPPPPAEEHSESSSSSESSDDSDSDIPDVQSIPALTNHDSPSLVKVPPVRRRSPSPTPPPATLPSLLPARDGEEDAAQKELLLKDRFRRLWMASMADAFADDLDSIRKEPNLTTSRLALLVDSLASGADVFTSARHGDMGINEMQVVLE
ncbi:hypothetical protein WOLCODRAFT_44027, partial [Wolfiporia cocos MD-104 SS10]